VTDPNLVYDLRAKLDASGHYYENEVDRVIKAELNPKGSQSELSAAIAPVADRLLKQYKAALEQMKAAKAKGDTTAATEAKETQDALLLFKRDLGTFLRVYAFLSQIFDYGNTDIEKRAIFYKRLMPLLEFGREREGVDLSKVVLTHHKLHDQGEQDLPLNYGQGDKLKPLTDPGTGEVQEKQKVFLSEIIQKVNELFEGDLTDNDKLVYVNNVLKEKLLESDLLAQQAANNSKEQFANSPDLTNEILNAVMDALEAHQVMSKQALDSEKVRVGLKDILLGPAMLYEALKERSSVAR
jgi:type I restriction enzyme R subunit